MLRIAGAQLPKGCAKHSGQSPDVKVMRPFPRDFGSVAAFPGFGEREMQEPGHKSVSQDPSPRSRPQAIPSPLPDSPIRTQAVGAGTR